MSGAQGDATGEQTDVGSYLIANYPPFSAWSSASIVNAQAAWTWREGMTPDLAQHKANELTLPEGRRL